MIVPFKDGDIIRHFKRDMLNDEAKSTNKYLYKVICIAKHTETQEFMLVYQALYYHFETFVRPLSMAMEEIDTEKYPYLKSIPNAQKHRLEVCDEQEDE